MNLSSLCLLCYNKTFQHAATHTLPISFYLVFQDMLFLNKTIHGYYYLNIKDFICFSHPAKDLRSSTFRETVLAQTWSFGPAGYTGTLMLKFAVKQETCSEMCLTYLSNSFRVPVWTFLTITTAPAYKSSANFFLTTSVLINILIHFNNLYAQDER